ncbi:S9 family peptidase [Crocinitomix algicola]|uniref:S9 family peptidase n=1 Tax=Crocinitomix algicola TaxID=1740263 RepID=UPI00082C7E21|nr:prolyl oligopeptidase family serine peptidase [Crocinitomix algicola]
MKQSLTLFLLLFTGINFSQNKLTIDHTVYDDWKTLSDVKLSKTGTLIAYAISPQKGDGETILYNTSTKKSIKFQRAIETGFSENEQFFTFRIKPQFDTIRALKLAKEKEENFPKDSLGIYSVTNDSLIKIPLVTSYSLSKNGNTLAYLSSEDERSPCPQKKCKLFGRKKQCKLPKTSGKTLVVLNLLTFEENLYHQVVSYKLDKKGKQLVYIKSEKGEADSLSLHHVNLETGQDNVITNNLLKISKLNFDETDEQLVFLQSNDTNKLKNYQLAYWNTDLPQAVVIVDSTTIGLDSNSTVSIYKAPYFSKNGEKIFFGTRPIVRQELKDTLLKTEKATVDVWRGNDLRIQPQQLKEKKRDERKTHLAVFHLLSKEVVTIENDSLENFRPINKGNSTIGLSYNYQPYQKSSTWDFPWKKDIYLTNIETGKHRLILQNQAYTASLSPSGKYLVWYSGSDSSWYSTHIANGQSINLTKNITAEFADENNGNPFIPYSQGSIGWTLINSKEYYLINSKYDIWALHPEDTQLSHSITREKGKELNTVYRYQRFDYDSTYTEINTNLIHGRNDLTKSESYHAPSEQFTGKNPLIATNHKFVSIQKSEQGNQIAFRRMSFKDYPELEISNLSFNNPTTISETNPQQSTYNWGTVEMVNWNSYDSIPLKGLLYKPEDFDSTKQYPMIVYFYEKYSNNIHNHYLPKPTASIVYPTEYVSNGYIIFIPDIEYTPGYPAKSAYNCIVSGTDYLLEQYSWIDSSRLGLQGQSWGGYQTAQLITMTTKYKAAMAGAPVSNMFSAYGGIRWGSGLSRMFQYEKTQSRIGYTIWEKPELYIENSPLFGLPNVRTPLLIMHNDGDGAVPWYQGIELFMGLRRLNQPVWLLNYNGDEHNLMQRANRIDLSIRMRQFFDHYLLNQPAPRWMTEGLPATEKGKNYGLEYKKTE